MSKKTAKDMVGRMAGTASIVVVAVLLGTGALAQVTQRVSLATDGAQGQADSLTPSGSSDARFVAFRSSASNLVAGDTNNSDDVFVRDRLLGTTERIPAIQPDGDSFGTPVISADGRFVAFQSIATNIEFETLGFWYDIFVCDRQTGTTSKVSRPSGSGPSGEVGGDSEDPSISADGRYVVYWSLASTLVPGDTNARADVFLRDRVASTTARVSLAHDGAQGDDDSAGAAISPDGRYVVFTSVATNLVPGDTNGFRDIFVRDLQSGSIARVSVSSSGAEGNGHSRIGYLKNQISNDGSTIVFQSVATNLVSSDTNGVEDVFSHDVLTGVTRRVSLDSAGVQGNAASSDPSISADGRCVVFVSSATNLVADDTNAAADVFVRDRQTGTTERVSVGWNGQHTAADNWWIARAPWISPDGRRVVFSSVAGTLVPGDTNLRIDVFLRDRLGGTEFSSHCDPGVAGVMACPCANPASGPGRGCDNSSGTGGATLSASGGAYLSSDSLVFTTSGEKPTALSILTQWTGSGPSGAVFGMGVRCTSGSFKRLYSKTAVGGSISAPNFGAGDQQVSVRAAALGDAIDAGASRWYFVYYRDATVLRGCPATSTFNATQTGSITWEP